MKLRTLGRTELAVSEIGFGCGPTGGLMINGSAAERREAVACALDLGINYFDTAAVYGAGVSETHLGETLRELGARVAVATKVALAPGDLRDIVGAVQRSVEDSLRRLGLGELALIQLHNRIGLERAAQAPFGTGALLASADVAGLDGVLEAFERLRTRGLVHHFGCSAFGGDMGMVRNLIDSDRFEVLTLHYSILNRTAWSAHQGAAMLDYAQVGRRAASRHMATVALRVLEGGALAEAGAAARRGPATCAAARPGWPKRWTVQASTRPRARFALCYPIRRLAWSSSDSPTSARSAQPRLIRIAVRWIEISRISSREPEASMKHREKVCLSPNGVDTYQIDSAPTSLLVGTMDGVVELSAGEDSGTWKALNRTLDGLHVGSLMSEPGGGAIFAGVHGEGLYRSLDGAATWETGMPGLTVPHVFSLTYDRRADALTLYAGTEPARLFRSRNLGDSWEEVPGLATAPARDKWWFPAPPHIAHVKHVAVDPRDERVIYVCVEQGALLKSSDGGERFEQLVFEDSGCRYNNDAHRIVFNPQNPDEIYLDGGDGIFRSLDAGRSWEHVATPRCGSRTRIISTSHRMTPARCSRSAAAIRPISGGAPEMPNRPSSGAAIAGAPGIRSAAGC